MRQASQLNFLPACNDSRKRTSQLGTRNNHYWLQEKSDFSRMSKTGIKKLGVSPCTRCDSSECNAQPISSRLVIYGTRIGHWLAHTISDLSNDILRHLVVSSPNNVAGTDVREVVGDPADDLLILRVTCRHRTSLVPVAALSHAHTSARTRTRREEDIARYQAHYRVRHYPGFD